jgi:hypothetical protein
MSVLDDFRKMQVAAQHKLFDDAWKGVDAQTEYDALHGDQVNHPPHYKQGDVECIDAIESALTAEEFRGHCKANALKYIWRERHKGQDESLKKAIWYLERALKA